MNIFESFLNGNKIDLTTKEGHDEFVEAANKLKNNSLFSMFGLNNFANSELDAAIAAADDIYANANKQIEAKPEAVVIQPSTKLTPEMKEQIEKIVNEYVDTMIKPNMQITEEQCENVRGAFLEFAAWIYTR